jgi:D-methionine transport system permease protein
MNFSWSDFGLSIGYTLGMVVISTLFAYLIGLPLGILLNVTSKNGLKPNKVVNTIFGVIVNLLRSIPCIILVVICMPWTRAWFGTGIGEWYTILIPLVMATFAFVARMVETSLQEVPAGEVEAIKSLGASSFQIITRVLLPEARSSLIAGFVVTLVNVIGYTSFAYNIGAGGLISDLYRYYTYHTGAFNDGTYLLDWVFWVMVIAIVALVQIVQEVGMFIARKIDKRKKVS